jgi:hypothetical protein
MHFIPLALRRGVLRKRKIELVSTCRLFTSRASPGDGDARGFEPAEIEIPSTRVPIPGPPVAVRWIGPMGESSDEAIGTGDLPRAEGNGLAIVQFARNWCVYVSTHAEEPPPARPW